MTSNIASSSSVEERQIDQLVLDAGPLLTQQAGLAGLAKKYFITPSVVAELRDKRARDHFDWLRSDVGGRCDVEVREPSVEARVAVTAFAKQTGDYSVLSQPDMSVLALTYALEVERHGTWRICDTVGGLTGQQRRTQEQKSAASSDQAKDGSAPREGGGGGGKRRGKKEKREQEKSASNEAPLAEQAAEERSQRKGEIDEAQSEFAKTSLADDASDAQTQAFEEEGDDDDEDDEDEGGQWITPENIVAHKSQALGLVSDADLSSFGPAIGAGKRTFGEGRVRTKNSDVDQDGWSTVVAVSKGELDRQNGFEASGKRGKEVKSGSSRMTVACLTGDYAVQNVLLQMGLQLVGLQGQKISQVRAWVLRCHACFKICKDGDRKFCPQCGNPTLLRTSVTSSANGNGNNGGVQVHLRKNFQYKNRGTKYSLPLPKAGKAAGVQASVPILREDQPEWQRAVAYERVQRQKQDRALQRALERGTDSLSARYEDADGLSILLAGKIAKQHTSGLPALGVGRRNPNERQRRKV